jgi:hypothetical protein
MNYECFYLRLKNGRLADAVKRGHATQCFDATLLVGPAASETPGKYESTVDIRPGEWTKVMIQISGKRALLFVNRSKQPVLVVNDLKRTVEEGPIALWVGPGTIAHFADLKITTHLE